MKPQAVICFYWQGDRWRDSGNTSVITDQSYRNNIGRNGYVDNELASQYVNNLYTGVITHSDRPVEFICFTNERLSLLGGIKAKKFPIISQKGVLPRLWMFSKESGLFGYQVLCLDIDVIIVGNLKPLLDYKGTFCTRSKFKPGGKYKLDGDIMSFDAGKENEERFWKPFEENTEEVEELTQGRERYWVRRVAGDIADRWDKIAPGAVVSYKWHVKRGRIPKKTAIVSCHGYPRPHQINDVEIKNHWNYV